MRPVFIKQYDEFDCGPACLCMIAQCYGKRIAITKIRALAGTDQSGTSAKGILKAAKSIGLSAKALISREKLLKDDLPCPFITHMKKDNGEHYVVVYKVKKEKILIADPGDSLHWINKKEFIDWWTGVFFFVAPSKEFIKTNDYKSFLERYWYLANQNKGIIIETIISSFILTILGILSAFYFRYLIDDVIYSYLPQSLISISFAYLLVIIIQSLLSFARGHLLMYLGNKIDVSLSLDYFKHILNLPLDFFTKRKSGEILSRLNDVENIKNALSNMTIGVLLDSIMLIFGGIVLFVFSSSLISIAVIPVIISGIMVLLLSKKFKQLIYQRSVLEAEKYSHFVESINGIATIKALSTEDDAYEKAEIKTIKGTKKAFSLGSLGNFQNTFQNFLYQAGNLAVYWYGSYLIMNEKLTLGELIAFVTLLGYFLGPLSRLITLQPHLHEVSVSSKRLGEILDLPTEEFLNSGTINISNTEGNLKIKNLSFSYGTRGYTLKKISIDIKPGEKIAFVGPSGSGKTTLVKLIMKFYNPEEGEILLDNKNILDINTVSYRNQFGYVPQEILLFSGTIGENIAWGNYDCTSQEIYEAAEKAQALDFISKLSDRFSTIVGERGASLSGGERQRIALARILLRKPKILILDEATSSLDSISEASIMKTINSISEKMTTIIVAHRLSTIKKCDKIFVLKNGTIVEQGTHDTLLEKKGVYSEMWHSQNEVDL